MPKAQKPPKDNYDVILASLSDNRDVDFELDLALALSLSLTEENLGESSYPSSFTSNSFTPNSLYSSSLPYETSSGSSTSPTSSPTTCSVCFMEMDGDIFAFDCCHIFCLKCCENHVKSKIEQIIVDIKCPLCPHILSQYDIKQLVPNAYFENWLKLSFVKHLDENHHVYFNCPTPNCPSIVEKTLFDVVKCPICEKSACSKCYMDHEENVECGKFEIWNTLNKEADKLFKERVDKGLLVKCGQCNRYIEKNGGCNNMVCRCGHTFVWTGKT